MLTGLSTMSYTAADGVAEIRFSRPEAANTLSIAFARDLREVMIAIEHDSSVVAVAVTAEGPMFSGGGDLKEFVGLGDALPRTASGLVTDYHSAMYRMNRMSKPFVAGVRGAAGGAGLSLVSSFDLVIAGESSKFTMGYTKVGMTPDGTSTYFLSRHVGLRRAMELTLTNRVLNASEALAWGLVNDVVPDDEVDDRVKQMAQSFASGPSRAIGIAKRLVYEGYESSLEETGEREAAEIVKSMASDDGREGIAAFTEKRAPQFGGQ